jgi:hypothetical protein
MRQRYIASKIGFSCLQALPRAFICSLLCGFLPQIALAATPTSVKATFEMFQNNILFAQVDETFTVRNGRYNVDSNANPAGILTWISKDKITRLSKGTITAQGLRPEYFEERKTSKGKDRVRVAQFNWNSRQLTLNFDGKTETTPLEQGTQDWGSLFYQFLFDAPAKDVVKTTVTDGRRVESYLYHFIDETNVNTAAGTFNALHYSHSDDKNERKTEIWLAKEKSFFPIRLIQQENGKVLEERLVALHID